MPDTTKDDFDRSFNFFANDSGAKVDGGEHELAHPTSDVFPFTVANSAQDHSVVDPSWHLAAFPGPSPPETSTPTVFVTVREQSSAMYDDVSQEGSTSLSGSICVRSAKAKQFTLVLKDDDMHIQRVEWIKGTTSGNSENGRRELCVDLTGTKSKDNVLVAKYFCHPKLRPVPLLVKSRVSLTKEHARVGFKVRANPSNQHVIDKMIVMMAVPPDVDGENCRMSRKGGSWEDLKRTLTWCISKIEPGEAVEIQCQFPVLEGSKAPAFPLLVRCDYPVLFSNIDFAIKDDPGIAMKFSFQETVLHRKV